MNWYNRSRLGKVGFEKATLNGSGRKLLDLCADIGLTITNTFFQHKYIHKYSRHIGSDGKTGTVCQILLINYLVISLELVTDTSMRRGVELSTDLYLMISKLWI